MSSPYTHSDSETTISVQDPDKLSSDNDSLADDKLRSNSNSSSSSTSTLPIASDQEADDEKVKEYYVKDEQAKDVDAKDEESRDVEAVESDWDPSWDDANSWLVVIGCFMFSAVVAGWGYVFILRHPV